MHSRVSAASVPNIRASRLLPVLRTSTSCSRRSRRASSFQSSAGAARRSASAADRSANASGVPELASSWAAAISTAPRARYRSAISPATSCGTKTPRAGCASSRPSWISRWKASRTGPRLTPSWRAISTSRRAWPGASRPVTIPERSCSAIRSGVESRRSGSSTSPMLICRSYSCHRRGIRCHRRGIRRPGHPRTGPARGVLLNCRTVDILTRPGCTGSCCPPACPWWRSTPCASTCR